MPAITFTLDLEDHTDAYAPNGRWVRNSHTILDWCAAQNIKGTFFTVGRAHMAPALLQRIVGEGHELALHSYDHIHLTKENPETFREKLKAAKSQFEDIAGAAVMGFRAPQFSLTPASHWVLDDLAALGFIYSSSIIPGKGMFQGYPGKPARPFQWENGVWEFPVPFLKIPPLTLRLPRTAGDATVRVDNGNGRKQENSAGISLPFLGGVYLRYLPLALVQFLNAQLPDDGVRWTYLHPYDIDEDEGFTRLTDGTPYWANWLLMHNRKGFLDKLARLMRGNAGPPLGKRINEIK